MALIYVDPIEGNDSNNGLTFATRKKSLRSGSIAAGNYGEVRIARTPGDFLGNATWVQRINAGPRSYTSITNLNATPNTGFQIYMANHGFSVGDCVYITGASSGFLNGFWVINAVPDANNFRIPFFKNINYGTSSSFGSPYVWNTQNCLVHLNSAKTKNLVNCVDGTGNYPTWFGSSNVTVYNYDAGSVNQDVLTQAPVTRFYWNSNFTIGKAAYHTFSSTQNLTGFRQLSLHYWANSGDYTGFPHVTIKLCSDSSGNTPVYEFPLPAIGYANDWQAVTIDCSNLASNLTMTTGINSIAIYVDQDRNYYQFQIQNIIACKGPLEDDCISHTSLISTKRSGDIWWPVLYVNEEYVFIGTYHPNRFITYAPGSYPNATGYILDTFNTTWSERQLGDRVLREPNMPTYVYNPVNTHLAAKSSTNQCLPTGNSDTTGEYIYYDNQTISGGWNRTDMSSIDNPGEDLSWFSNGFCTSGVALYFSGVSDSNFSNLGIHGGNYGMYVQNNCFRNTFTNIHTAACGTAIYHRQDCGNNKFTNTTGCNIFRTYNIQFKSWNVSVKDHIERSMDGFLYSGDAARLSFENINIRNTSGYDFYTYRCRNINIKGINSRYNHRYNFYADGNCPHFSVRDYTSTSANGFMYLNHHSSAANYYGWRLDDIVVTDHGNYSYYLNPGTAVTGNQISSSILDYVTGGMPHGDPTIQIKDNSGWVAASGSIQLSHDVDTDPNSQSTRSLEAVQSYEKIQRNNSLNIPESNPDNGLYSGGNGQRFILAEVSVNANSTTTLTATCKRTSGSFEACLIVQPQLGISTKIRSPFVSSVNTWEDISIDVTPIRSGVIKFEVEMRQFYGNALGGPSRLLIDNITCVQT